MAKRGRDEEVAATGAQNALSLFDRLTDAEQQKVYAEAYTMGGFNEIHPEPGASANYNAFAKAVESLSEEEFEEFSEEMQGRMGGRRRRGRRKTIKKKGGKRRKTRRRN